MANTKELRRRIKSVKNTAQITKAMQMVAATKTRKAQNQALSGRPYNHNLNLALNCLLDRIDKSRHPLLQANSGENIGVLLLSTDKSLCGALNTNTFRLVQNFVKERANENFVFYTVGKKGRNFVVKTDKFLEADFENHETVTFRQASQIAKIFLESYLENKVKEVYVIYPDFVNTLRQEPKFVKLLPIENFHVEESLEEKKSNEKNDECMGEFLFEPNVDELLEEILVHEIQVKVYQALLETKASEHSARMIAMQNATDNAEELVEDLKLSYNQTRQDAITRELLEITSAVAALE